MKERTLTTFASATVLLALALVAQITNAQRPPRPNPRPNPQPTRVKFELFVFTWREPGICPPCDRARPIVKKLEREYPIKRVYTEAPNASALRAQWRVDRYPTFILVARPDYGAPRELARWSGANDLERRIRAAFASVAARR